MPRAKRTGDASSSTPPPTKKTKENQSALTREIFPERNFDLTPAANIRRSPALDLLRECIVSQSLRNLACCNEEYNETLVREFYHRFPGGVENHVREVKFKVRGKTITLDRELIEAVLELPHVSDADEVSYFAAIGPISTSALHDTTYTDPRAVVTQGSSCIKGSLMTEAYRALWLFVRYNLIPTSQKAEVPIESCKLLVQMRTGERPIPYARLILSAIIGSAGRTFLFFPCVITRICRHLGVREDTRDLFIRDIGILDERIFARSVTQVRRTQPPPPPQPQPDPQPHPSVPFGGDAPGSSQSLPFDPSLVDPHTHAMIQYYHGLTMGRFDAMESRLGGRLDTMEELIRQIADMMPRDDQGGAEQTEDVDEGPGDAS